MCKMTIWLQTSIIPTQMDLHLIFYRKITNQGYGSDDVRKRQFGSYILMENVATISK